MWALFLCAIFTFSFMEINQKEEPIMAVILVVIGIANLAVSLYIARMLKRIGNELNQIEDWKSIPKKHYF